MQLTIISFTCFVSGVLLFLNDACSMPRASSLRSEHAGWSKTRSMRESQDAAKSR
jgi:hypothetical protein